MASVEWELMRINGVVYWVSPVDRQAALRAGGTVADDNDMRTVYGTKPPVWNPLGHTLTPGPAATPTVSTPVSTNIPPGTPLSTGLSPGAVPTTTQWAYAQQEPAMEFTRFLKELGGGAGLSAAAQRGAEPQLDRLANFAKLSQAGTRPETLEAQTNPYLTYFRQMQGQMPSRASLEQQVSDVLASLAQGGVPRTGETGERALRLSDLYALYGQSEAKGGVGAAQRGLVENVLGAFTPDFLGTARQRGLENLYREQQTATPEMPFLEYARRLGLV